MRVLITGGAGYIGSHTAIDLIHHGHEVVIADNFSNSNPVVLERLKKITSKEIVACRGDLCDQEFVRSLFSDHQIDAVIHFAGLKAVGESVEHPLAYYRNNIDSTLTLCEEMRAAGVHKLLFSSSASVYGNSRDLPMKESSQVGIGILSPYGRTKYMIEEILRDLAASDSSWSITALRYFNPIGADKSGLIGEDPSGIPNNVFPYIAQVAAGKLDRLNVFGGDYDTKDGTGVRDYIHVSDLASGHVAALNKMGDGDGFRVYNLGTGVGVSVLELIRAFEKGSRQIVPFKLVERRAGDPAESYSDPSKSWRELGWKATRTLEEACADSWKWQYNNPDGYTTT